MRLRPHHTGSEPDFRFTSNKYKGLNIVVKPQKVVLIQSFWNSKDASYMCHVHFHELTLFLLFSSFLILIFPLSPFSHLPDKFYPAHCLHLCKLSQIFSEIKWSKETNTPKCLQVSFKIAPQMEALSLVCTFLSKLFSKKQKTLLFSVPWQERKCCYSILNQTNFPKLFGEGKIQVVTAQQDKRKEVMIHLHTHEYMQRLLSLLEYLFEIFFLLFM